MSLIYPVQRSPTQSKNDFDNRPYCRRRRATERIVITTFTRGGLAELAEGFGMRWAFWFGLHPIVLTYRLNYAIVNNSMTPKERAVRRALIIGGGAAALTALMVPELLQPRDLGVRIDEKTLLFSDPILPPDGYTVEAWMKLMPSVATGWPRTVFSQQSYGSGRETHCWVSPDGQFQVVYWDGGPQYLNSYSANGTLYVHGSMASLGPERYNWHHIAFSQGDHVALFHIDGREVIRKPSDGSTGYTQPSGLSLGAAMVGTIDDPYFYWRDALSGDLNNVRITRGVRYGGNFTPQRVLLPDQNTMALWPLERDLRDVSGNGHHLAFRGESPSFL